MSTVRISRAEWLKEWERRYGPSLRKGTFRCPICGYVQSGQDFLDLGVEPKDAAGYVAFSCIGRWKPGSQKAFGETGKGPCDFTNGGLLRLGPIIVVDDEGDEHFVFDFADEPLEAALEITVSG
jgi:hypothetical protein